jgi:GAF domain-containing protein
MNNNIPSLQPSGIEKNIQTAFDYQGWREQFILIILRIASVLGVALIALSYSTATISDKILFFSIYLALLIITLLKMRYLIRAITLLLMVFAIGVNSILAWGPWLDGSVFFIAFIVLSALLFNQRIDFIALFISVATFAVIAALQLTGIYQFKTPNVPATTLTDWAAYTVNFSIISAILIIAIHQLKAEFTKVVVEAQNTFKELTEDRAQLETKVNERSNELELRALQIRSSASISRTITELQEVSELMEMTTKLTSDQFGYYHVGLYLFDENNKTAFLQAASSAAGKQLIGEGFRIDRDRNNIFNLVVENNRPYIASDADNINYIRDTNFPLTRSRLMMPLTVRNKIIGVLDMHSDQPQVFNSQDAEVLQTLADLVAISIDNERLLNETRNLVFQLETNTSVQTRETWTKFTSRHKPAYQYTPAGVRPLFVNNRQDNLDGLRVPLMLHGQMIGSITLKRKGVSTSWSERERILVEKVANQAALALENSRLVDETQKNALRDQVIANVSARVRETLDIESVLRTATTELRRVFDLKEVEVSIGAAKTENAPAKKHTSSLRLKSDKG